MFFETVSLQKKTSFKEHEQPQISYGPIHDNSQEKKTLIEAGDEEGAKALEEKGMESIISMEEIDMENLDVSGPGRTKIWVVATHFFLVFIPTNLGVHDPIWRLHMIFQMGLVVTTTT